MRMQSRGCHGATCMWLRMLTIIILSGAGAGIGRPINFISIVLKDKVLAT